MHNWCIRSFYSEKRQQHSVRLILRMSINGVSMILGFASWLIYVLIGCRHLFIRYWKPLLAKITVTCSLPHPENERQRSINSCSSSIFGYRGIVRIFVLITESFTALTGKSAKYQWYNTDSKLIDIANRKACKNLLWIVENAILTRYYLQTAKARAIYESIDGPAGRPSDNPPNSDGLVPFHWTLCELTVRIYRWPGQPIWRWFGLDPDTDPKWWSGTVPNTQGRW